MLISYIYSSITSLSSHIRNNISPLVKLFALFWWNSGLKIKYSTRYKKNIDSWNHVFMWLFITSLKVSCKQIMNQIPCEASGPLSREGIPWCSIGHTSSKPLFIWPSISWRITRGKEQLEASVMIVAGILMLTRIHISMDMCVFALPSQ